jgi:Uma2 family endonuclease
MGSAEALHDLQQEQIEQNSDRTAPVNSLAPDEGRHVTLEEYWDKWYEHPYPDIDVSYEWNNGILEAKFLANAPQLDLGFWFLALLHQYVKTHDNAKLINMETGFVLTMQDEAEPSGMRKAVRKPDIGIILNSNPVSWGRVDQRSFAGVCDAVVEFLSDSTQTEVRRDTEEKKRDYALAGVKEYTILDPSGEHMHFYHLTPQERYEEIQPDAEEVIHSEVLPGFQFRIGDLWRLPRLAKLALDEVYAGFVIPDLKVAVTRAEDAEARVEVEAQRADAESAARQQAVERVQELEAELARSRRRSS